MVCVVPVVWVVAIEELGGLRCWDSWYLQSCTCHVYFMCTNTILCFSNICILFLLRFNLTCEKKRNNRISSFSFEMPDEPPCYVSQWCLYLILILYFCVSHSGLVVSKHGLQVGSLGSIHTTATTGTAVGGDAEHVSLNH